MADICQFHSIGTPGSRTSHAKRMNAWNDSCERPRTSSAIFLLSTKSRTANVTTHLPVYVRAAMQYVVPALILHQSKVASLDHALLR